MDRDEWLRRCAAQYETRTGVHLNCARELAQIALEADEDGDFDDAPEDAADADIECWDGDGET